MLRFLRVAVVALCLITSVLLVALWIRSYWQMDQFIRRNSTADYVAFTTVEGTFVVGKSNYVVLQQVFQERWTRRQLSVEDLEAGTETNVAFFPCNIPQKTELIRVPRFLGNPWQTSPGTSSYELILPFWLLVLFTASIAALLIKPRFRIRTLIVAISLIALLFGLAAISK